MTGRSKLFGILVVATTVSLLAAPATATTDAFSDVPPGAYYADAATWMHTHDVVAGTSADTFSPHDPVTNAQMAAVLWRLSGSQPGVHHPYSDVASTAYFAEAAGWARLHGLMDTLGVEFAPNAPVTRAVFAETLWRFSGEPIVAFAMPFNDVDRGRSQFDAVRWLAHTGITRGTGPSTFSPDGVVTRGQLVTFLWRFIGEPEKSRQVARPSPWIGQLVKQAVAKGGTEIVDLDADAINIVVVDELDHGPVLAVATDSGHASLVVEAPQDLSVGTYRSVVATVRCQGAQPCGPDRWVYDALTFFADVVPEG